MSNRGARGTADWQQFEIVLSVPANTTNINFGVLHPGNGTAWFERYHIVRFRFRIFRSERLFHRGRRLQCPTGRQCRPHRQAEPAPHVQRRTDSFERGDCRSMRRSCCAHGILPRRLLEPGLHQGGNRLGHSECSYRGAGCRLSAEFRCSGPRYGRQRQVDRRSAAAGSKIVLWAHDYHVSRYDGAMGPYLAKRYGKDYVVLGFGFHEGSYNANGAQGLRPYDAAPARRRRTSPAAHGFSMTCSSALSAQSRSTDSPRPAWYTITML